MRLAIVLLAALAAPVLADEPARPVPARNGSAFLSADLRALQTDDFANPMALWVRRGKDYWSRPYQGRSCAGCHGEASASMKGVAARYPKYDAGADEVIDLARRINGCVVGGLGAPKLAAESDDLLGLEAYIAKQSRGLPMSVSIDGPAHATWEKGRDLYFTRIGQLDLACTSCHDASWGKTLLAETISQGQPTGWPAYRFEWQRPGSLQRRLRACFNGVRAAMPPFGSPDLVALELYLAWRAQGLPMEAPGVRR
ncbi:MAG TPA: sulfur oxidation c-type cytochrome SoxA [Usitatibacter sp.]|nr:sulfur oxidation c-type cytochrome SoxA [Usitatibacter sp.]